MFLHGYPLNHEMWGPQLEGLSARHRVVLFDLPGYGQTRGHAVPDTLSGFAEHIHANLIRRAEGPVAIVGHSFGGYIALELLRTHPEDFRALILTNTRSEADSPEARAKRLATIRRLEDPAQTLDVEATAQSLLAPATWHAAGALVETVRGMIRSAPSQTVSATLKAIADRADLTQVLSRIRVPTLVLWGEQDQLIPPSQTQSMVARIQGCSGVGVPDAGHLPSLESPRVFDRALDAFLRRLPD